MKRFAIRLILIAISLKLVLPMLPGFSFHGGFIEALGAAIFFTILAWIVELLAVFLSTLLTITTMGLALLLIVPIWILGFWLMPALVLKLLADLLPGYLSITGWVPAIWGGLVMFLVGIVTGDKPEKYRKVAD